MHAGSPAASPEITQYLRFGPSPRGAQALILGGKVNALLAGRVSVSYEDIDDTVLSALRHRLLRNFQAEAENVSTEATPRAGHQTHQAACDLARLRTRHGVPDRGTKWAQSAAPEALPRRAKPLRRSVAESKRNRMLRSRGKI